jgi:hypothetical protein
VEDIKAEKLNAIQVVAGHAHTLWSFIQDIQWPLNPKEDEDMTPLFHSVDWATSGPNAGKTILHLTAY